MFNERDNIRPLTDDILREVGKLGRTFEVILVNDGSYDGSTEMLDAVAAEHPEVKVIHFVTNSGQTIAMAAGMYESLGRVVVTMDGDRQNDPSDIGMLLDKLDEGYACVSGWRKNRQDSGLRRLVSRAANRIIQHLSGVPVHDLGCTLKAYRADALDPRDLFGEMHRFLPQHVLARGGRVAELVVKHHPRVAGESKYGFGRIHRVISDIVLVRVLLKYKTRPSHMFAKLAQYLFLAGACIFVLGVALRLAFGWGVWQVGLLSAVAAWVGALILLATGWNAEVEMRNRYLLSDRLQWNVARRVNFDHSAA